MTFFQLLVTDNYTSSIDITYRNVYNYATLADALNSTPYRARDNKKVADGETFEDFTGVKLCQFHLTYTDNAGVATIELRHEYFGTPEGCSTEQVVAMQSVIIKEIIL